MTGNTEKENQVPQYTPNSNKLLLIKEENGLNIPITPEMKKLDKKRIYKLGNLIEESNQYLNKDSNVSMIQINKDIDSLENSQEIVPKVMEKIFTLSHGSSSTVSSMELSGSFQNKTQKEDNHTLSLNSERSFSRRNQFFEEDSSLNEILLDSPSSPIESRKIDIDKLFSDDKLEIDEFSSRINDDLKEMAPHGLHVYCCLNAVRPPSLQTSIENGVYTCEYKINNISSIGKNRIKHIAKQDAATNMLYQLFTNKRDLREIYQEMDQQIATSDRNLKPLLQGTSIDACQLLNEIVTFYNFEKMEPTYIKEKDHYKCIMYVKYKDKEFKCDSIGVNPKQVKKICAIQVLNVLFPNLDLVDIRKKIEKERNKKEQSKLIDSNKSRERKKENLNPNTKYLTSRISKKTYKDSKSSEDLLEKLPLNMIQVPNGRMIPVKIVPINSEDIQLATSLTSSNLIINPFIFPPLTLQIQKISEK